VPSGSSPVGGGRPPAAVVVVKQWTPVLDLRLALGAPLAGALVGLLAGLYPSLRAARMEPVDALRAPS
jgi:putative ABC transport system permease protein